MPSATPAKLLRLHICEDDRYQGKPLYEAVVEKCREMDLAGATVFRGREGFGETGDMHHRPVIVVIVDTADKIAAAIPALEDMMTTGVMAVSEVAITRLHQA